MGQLQMVTVGSGNLKEFENHCFIDNVSLEEEQQHRIMPDDYIHNSAFCM